MPCRMSRECATLDTMSERLSGWMAVGAALLVLFSAMWEPLVSAIVAAAALALLGVYELTRRRRC
jgi:hypothetical protein